MSLLAGIPAVDADFTTPDWSPPDRGVARLRARRPEHRHVPLAGSGRPWRPRLDTASLRAEMFYLRTACWIVIAYLSGMRDTEVRELARDCAFTEPGRMAAPAASSAAGSSKAAVSRGTRKNGVVLDVVHGMLFTRWLAINDDATHLFGYSGVRKDGMNANMLTRLNDFAAHVNDLLTPPGGEAFIPGHGDSQVPGESTTRQFRLKLACISPTSRSGSWPCWPVQTRPGHDLRRLRRTSASGFAAEVEQEQAVACLDHAEDLYRDWLAGGSGGGASHKINAEFADDAARRPARHHRRPQAPAHPAQPPGRHLAPRRARRLLLPARHRALRQACQADLATRSPCRC